MNCKIRLTRKELDKGLSFGSSIKSGTDKSDTWHKMITAIPGIHKNTADAIVRAFPTFKCFYAKFESANQLQRERLLTCIETSQHKIGPKSAEKILASIFGRDQCASVS